MGCTGICCYLDLPPHQPLLKKRQRPLFCICGGRAVKAVARAGVHHHFGRLAKAAGHFYQLLAFFDGHNGIRIAVQFQQGRHVGDGGVLPAVRCAGMPP